MNAYDRGVQDGQLDFDHGLRTPHESSSSYLSGYEDGWRLRELEYEEWLELEDSPLDLEDGEGIWD